jgi:ribosomal protein S18 acetylase RimI-like enzyme
MAEFRIVRAWSPLEELCRVELAAAERYWEAGYDPNPWPPTTVRDFVEYQALGLLWVAVMDANAVGIAVVDVYGEYFHLEEIDVLPEFQGRGVGTALIREVIAEGNRRGSASVTLRTFLTTPWSVGLYEKLGFRRWDPDPVPEFLNGIFEEERVQGLMRDERLTMRLLLGRD